jgi:hypothetical protein
MIATALLNVVLGEMVVVVVVDIVITGENVLLHGGNLLIGAEPARPGGRDELLGDADIGLPMIPPKNGGEGKGVFYIMLGEGGGGDESVCLKVWKRTTERQHGRHLSLSPHISHIDTH